MIVCDSCKRVSEPAYPVRLSFGLCKNPEKPGNASILINISAHPSTTFAKLDLCEQCAKILQDKIGELLEPMFHTGTQTKRARVGEFATPEQIQALHCPKSPDGTHLFMFGRAGKKPVACEYCGTTTVAHGETFNTQSTIPHTVE